MDTKDKWSEEVVLCGSGCPCSADVDYVSAPMPLAKALATMAICDNQMEQMGIIYVYIVDCKGNILAEKTIR